MSAMSAAERGDAPRQTGPALVPFGLTMQALLASCAAATAVSTPPKSEQHEDGEDGGGGETGEEPAAA
ncbi:hypothetical protein [Streptomyces sp. NPDC051211]|uniref:hypothetical protein n=1 Tax=Streptomyces sp. NPDC051211 TaxID=3154643 RepID=UPI00344D4FCD